MIRKNNYEKSAMKICKNCGNKIVKNDTYCSYCGTKKQQGEKELLEERERRYNEEMKLYKEELNMYE